MEVHALRLVLHIVVGKACAAFVGIGAARGQVEEVEVDRDVHHHRDVLALEAGDRALEELAVELEAHGGDVSALLAA